MQHFSLLVQYNSELTVIFITLHKAYISEYTWYSIFTRVLSCNILSTNWLRCGFLSLNGNCMPWETYEMSLEDMSPINIINIHQQSICSSHKDREMGTKRQLD